MAHLYWNWTNTKKKRRQTLISNKWFLRKLRNVLIFISLYIVIMLKLVIIIMVIIINLILKRFENIYNTKIRLIL